MIAPHYAPHSPARWLTQADRDVLLAVPVGLVVFALTLVLAWPLRFDGEMIWVALAAL